MFGFARSQVRLLEEVQLTTNTSCSQLVSITGRKGVDDLTGQCLLVFQLTLSIQLRVDSKEP